MVRQSGVREESYRTDGQMSGSLHFPASTCTSAGEAALVEVSLEEIFSQITTLICSRFMFDKILPLSEALEGYEIFDKMQAQKVVFTIPMAQ